MIKALASFLGAGAVAGVLLVTCIIANGVLINHGENKSEE